MSANLWDKDICWHLGIHTVTQSAICSHAWIHRAFCPVVSHAFFMGFYKVPSPLLVEFKRTCYCNQRVQVIAIKFAIKEHMRRREAHSRCCQVGLWSPRAQEWPPEWLIRVPHTSASYEWPTRVAQEWSGVHNTWRQRIKCKGWMQRAGYGTNALREKEWQLIAGDSHQVLVRH